MGSPQSVELKGIINDVISGMLQLFDTEQWRGMISEYVRENYRKGLNKEELKFNMNFMGDEKDLQNLETYAFESVANTHDELGKQLRSELQRGILNKESVTQLKKRIQDTFKDKKYMDRLKTVIRTEGLRAGNAGSFQGALESKKKLNKYVDIVDDQFTSEICHAEYRKYGSPDKAIPLEKDFIVKVRNKTYRAKYPPFHPNCRTKPEYVEIGERRRDEILGSPEDVERFIKGVS